jgi:hypothetical protein
MTDPKRRITAEEIKEIRNQRLDHFHSAGSKIAFDLVAVTLPRVLSALEQAYAENEKLREALKLISEFDDDDYSCNIARQALTLRWKQEVRMENKEDEWEHWKSVPESELTRLRKVESVCKELRGLFQYVHEMTVHSKKVEDCGYCEAITRAYAVLNPIPKSGQLREKEGGG